MNQNLVGKLFEDVAGNVVKVNNIDGQIAHLDTGQRVAIERLLDTTYYNEHVDPDLFSSKESNFYTFLGNEIKNIDTNSVGNLDPGTQIHSNIPVVERHEDAQRALKGEYTTSHENYTDLEARRREMAENAANMSKNVQNTNSKFKEILGDESDNEDKVPLNRNLEGVVMEGTDQPVQRPVENRDTSVNMYDENNNPVNSQPQQNQPQQHNPHFGPQEDPIYKMFKAVKRSQKLAITIKLDEMIPKKDFIKMWEESYEISIIDHLADEFYQKLMKNPDIIRDQIKAAVQKKVYPPKRKRRSTTKKKTTTKKSNKNDSDSKSETDKKSDKKSNS